MSTREASLVEFLATNRRNSNQHRVTNEGVPSLPVSRRSLTAPSSPAPLTVTPRRRHLLASNLQRNAAPVYVSSILNMGVPSPTISLSRSSPVYQSILRVAQTRQLIQRQENTLLSPPFSSHITPTNTASAPTNSFTLHQNTTNLPLRIRNTFNLGAMRQNDLARLPAARQHVLNLPAQTPTQPATLRPGSVSVITDISPSTATQLAKVSTEPLMAPSTMLFAPEGISDDDKDGKPSTRLYVQELRDLDIICGR